MKEECCGSRHKVRTLQVCTNYKDEVIQPPAGIPGRTGRRGVERKPRQEKVCISCWQGGKERGKNKT